MIDRRVRQRSSDLPWVETAATVIASAYEQNAWGQDAKEGGSSLDYFVTKFAYRVNGTAYQGELRSADLRQLGSKFSIRYDPSNPHYNSVTVAEKPPVGKVMSWAFVMLGVLILVLILRYLL